MDFEKFKLIMLGVGAGACLGHALFSGRLWRYRVVAHQCHGGETMWWAQRRAVFLPFWGNLHYHSATGHDWTPTAYSSEDDAIRSLPAGCEFYVIRRGSRAH